MDFKKLEMTQNYLGGMSFKDHATREYEYTITNTKLKGTIIRHSIYTPRISEFEWGVQKDKFWIVGKEKEKYKTLKELKFALTNMELKQI